MTATLGTLSFPLKQLLVERTDNKPNKPFPGGTADYITVHQTGNRKAGADAESHARWMYSSAPYSWHATVDDHEAWQSIAWGEQGWHAGDGYWGRGNQESIGLELCMAVGMDLEAVYEHAAELVAALLDAGHGSKGVVQHNHWSGKNCPELIRAEQGRWEWFLARVEFYRGRETDMDDEEFATRMFDVGKARGWWDDFGPMDARLRPVLVNRNALAAFALTGEPADVAWALARLSEAGKLPYPDERRK